MRNGEVLLVGVKLDSPGTREPLHYTRALCYLGLALRHCASATGNVNNLSLWLLDGRAAPQRPRPDVPTAHTRFAHYIFRPLAVLCKCFDLLRHFILIRSSAKGLWNSNRTVKYSLAPSFELMKMSLWLNTLLCLEILLELTGKIMALLIKHHDHRLFIFRIN